MTRKTHNSGERLSAYLDGELNPRERAELERQLAADAALRCELEGLSEVKRRVGGLERVAAPPGLRAAISGQLERRMLLAGGEPVRVGIWVRLTRWSAAAALVLIASALTFAIVRHVSPPRPAERPLQVAVAPSVAATEPARPEPTAAPAIVAHAPALEPAPLPKAIGKHAPPPLAPVLGKSLSVALPEGGAGADQVGQVREGKPPETLALTEGQTLAKGKGHALPERSLAKPETDLLQWTAGAPQPGPLLAADFSQEQIILDVPARDAKEQRQLTRQIDRFLATHGAVAIDSQQEIAGAQLKVGQADVQSLARPEGLARPLDGRQSQILVRVRSGPANDLVCIAKDDTFGRAQVVRQRQVIEQPARLAESFQQLATPMPEDRRRDLFSRGGGQPDDADQDWVELAVRVYVPRSDQPPPATRPTAASLPSDQARQPSPPAATEPGR